MEDKLIIVSADSHAGVPHDLWREYLASEFHDLLPALERDIDINTMATYLLGAKMGFAGFPEHQDAHREDWHGLYDPVLRMADMDREGITAELIYLGDSRLGDLFHNVTGRDYGRDAWDAGARAWNRWAADAFGFAMERFLVTGAIGPCDDMPGTIAEVEWMADHQFTGIYGPGYLHHADMPPLYDEYWDPFWAACAAHDIPMVVHAGFGTEYGAVFPEIEKIYKDVAAAAGTTDKAELLAHADAVEGSSQQFFFDFLNHGIEARRPMWQMMLGGVFDRHPALKLIVSEIRLDWIPATLNFLDAVFDEHRSELPAKRKPSEYWISNCLAGASFVHKAEIEMRHEIGVDTILFGRDFPHQEGTWPHTRDFLRVAFAGVPAREAELMLGGNAIRFLNLDEARLAQIAKRIGPRLEDIIDAGTDIRPELLESFDQRGGFLKPAERDSKLPFVEPVLREDVEGLVGPRR